MNKPSEPKFKIFKYLIKFENNILNYLPKEIYKIQFFLYNS